MPGGVSSPVRAYSAVGRKPFFAASGRGPYITDLDGNRIIDYVCSYGPLIHGHAPPPILLAIHEAAVAGSTFGLPTEAETQLAEMVTQALTSIDLVRFVSSGTEAALSAIRLARAATGRSKLVKCTGGYHGHTDALLVEAGSGAATLGVPSSPGVPNGVAADTLVLPFNDVDAATRLFDAYGDSIACMIVEPVAGNMGCVPPQTGYLDHLRELCDRSRSLLIFDEVMTGFRVSYGGAQELYTVMPDLTCLGKILGGGLPCAAYGGREELMRQIAPDGPVYQAGTLSGNPLAMAAGIATLESLRDGQAYARLEQTGASLAAGLDRAAAAAEVPVYVTRVGSMIGCFFTGDGRRGAVIDYEQAAACDTAAFALFFSAMLQRGVLLPPSQFETWFISTAHDEACIEQTINAAFESFNVVASARRPEATVS